ncbi:hypothetical protein ACFL56_02285 [Candidatus Margulisiibacteriota bacterium]
MTKKKKSKSPKAMKTLRSSTSNAKSERQRRKSGAGKKITKKDLPADSQKELQELIKELKKYKIYFSDGENTAKMKEWLKNKYSGYPDLTEKILKILKGKKIVGHGVPLDNIGGKYGYAIEHDLKKVEAAYIKAWREKNDI